MENNLSILMGEKKANIADVHNGTGLPRTTISSLYHEVNPNPSTKVVMKLCKYFEVTPNDFFGIKGERNYG
ncbi:helix-turn-helix transcriptional regulator [Staphylococcus saprophyticus]|uniref:helix-turn-helix domain-containing protein n=1 Tax=Staphylococcus saprophyticus TaxID=29385 RepID=UPI00085342AC|nr:helix-turn-helix transcriptional regulator [Staphylococcus saprophyticus]MDW4159696.1 helix-turn-helix transcriptional regulator [Staphylococcus saprophyticus]MDW4162140.1 helix-turn-helix transcriptional regulator [Staphylococcus saprophyticus]MDW4166581.1 helix-turn-helix transcriptional regulator [Staphylococcus saprophyticus]MDW4194028.1 helix-turn-helix transcriptional regulator [Staphylococcus saprophyticus]MDW4309866.1 helix-turn-helix transcriptional regulator [Staphylococcus saprop